MKSLEHKLCSILFVLPVLLSAGACTMIEKMAWTHINRRIRAEYPSVQQISTEELANWLKNPETQQPVLLDTREPEEYRVSHLKDAGLAGSLAEALNYLSKEDTNRTIVLYCAVGYRSAKMAAGLIKKGYREVYNLKGSIFQWANEGRPVYAGGKRTEKVHPYDWKWSRLLKQELRADPDQ
jgi:rhodanese-related sulfurtransferase